MDGELPVAHEERLILRKAVHPLDAFFSHAVLNMFCLVIRFEVPELPGRDKAAGRPWPRPMGDIHIEAVFERTEGFPS